MPTAYTEPIHAGESITVKEYIARCARAFGPLSYLRDEPLSNELPDTIPESTYYQEQYEKAKNRLAKLSALTPEEIHIEAEKEYDESIQSRIHFNEQIKEENQRYEDMGKLVSKWKPKDPVYNELRHFALDQLRISYTPPYANAVKIEREDDEAWYRTALRRAVQDMEYYANEAEEERKRYRTRMAWLANLKKELEDLDA